MQPWRQVRWISKRSSLGRVGVCRCSNQVEAEAMLELWCVCLEQFFHLLSHVNA